MNNWKYGLTVPNLSHRGQVTIPRQLGIRVLNSAAHQYRLISTPAPELFIIRHPLQSYNLNETVSVNPQTLIPLTDRMNFKTPTMELEISLEMKNNPKFSICAFNDVNEEICFGFESTQWFLDRSKSGNIDFNEEYRKTLYAHAAREITDETTTIKIFLDVSSIEVFADSGLTTMTALHFPSKPFDKFYISHWSNAVSLSTVTVKNFSVYGLECWFSQALSNHAVCSYSHLFNSVILFTIVMHLVYSLKHSNIESD